MLELLLYCHMFAKLRYAAEIAAISEAVIDLFDRMKARYASSAVARSALAAPARQTKALPFGAWTERDIATALDRLNAFVASAA